MEPVVAQAAVLRVADVQPPQGPLAARDPRVQPGAAHRGEQVIDLHPLPARAVRQCQGDDLAPGLDRGQRVDRPLALDRLDPAELIDHTVADPPLPQCGDRARGRPGQRRPPACRQPQPPASQLRQATGLHQQRPREGADRLGRVEVAPDQRLRHHGDGGRARHPGLLAAPQLPGRAQLQDRPQVRQRLTLRRAHDEPALILGHAGRLYGRPRAAPHRRGRTKATNRLRAAAGRGSRAGVAGCASGQG